MDTIDRNMRSLPKEVKFSLITLLTGDNNHIELVLPDQLDELKRIAQKSRSSAEATVEAFTVVKNVLEELVQSATVTQKHSNNRVQALDLQISEAKSREILLKNRRKEAKETRDKVKTQLEKAENDWEKALDNLPTGWTIMGLKVCETLTNTLVTVVELVSGQLPDAIEKAISNLDILPNVVNTVSEKLIGEKIMPTGNKKKEQKEKPDDEPPPSIAFPACNLAPAQSRRVTITEKLKVGLNFQAAVTNMMLTVEQLEQYIDTIFVRPSLNKLSLSPEAESVTNSVMNLLRPNKDQIENSGENTIPWAMRGSAVTFYRKIFEFMDEVIKADKNRGTPPIDLERQAKDLRANGQCFYSWMIKLLDLPPIPPKAPFNENQNKPNSFTEAHVENAKFKVESLKNLMEEKEEAFQEASTRLMIVSHNITETIMKLAAFDASKATLEEVIE